MSAPVLIAVTHLLGAGHLTRATALARAFAAAGHPVTLVSGGMPAPWCETERLRLVQIPPVRILGTAFGVLLDEAGLPVRPERLAARRETLLAALAQTRPAAVITELHPFGRRVLAAEFDALVAAAGASRLRPLILASVRDILATPSRPDRIAATHARLADYDGVLVHADPTLIDLRASWPADAIPVPLHDTGYVDEGADDGAAAGDGGIVVSGGSSAAGLPLQEAALATAARLPDRSWRILVGRAIAQDRLEDLRARAPANAIVERARPDFRALLRGADLSISQAGYNTAVDVLAAGCRALLVPFEAGRETEQRLRAEMLARHGLAAVLPEAELTPERLAGEASALLARPRPEPMAVALDGAPRTVAVVRALLAGRSEPRIFVGAAPGGAHPLAPPAGRGTRLPFTGERGEAAADREGATPEKPHPATPPHRHFGFASASRRHDEVPAGLAPPGGERGRAPALASIRIDWSALDEAIERAAGRGQAPRVWWRDDDAVASTPALDRLLALAQRFGWPLTIASVPGRAEASLTDRIADETAIDIAVHGLIHRNHAPAGEKKAELGPHRPPEALVGDAREALRLGRERLGPRLLPVLVPPWNRIAPDLVARLPGLGYRALSVFGPAGTLPGIRRINSHVDPIAWRTPGRGLADPAELLARAAAALDGGEPVGLLTHHGGQPEAVWAFVETFLERLSRGRDVERARLSGLLATGSFARAEP